MVLMIKNPPPLMSIEVTLANRQFGPASNEPPGIEIDPDKEPLAVTFTEEITESDNAPVPSLSVPESVNKNVVLPSVRVRAPVVVILPASVRAAPYAMIEDPSPVTLMLRVHAAAFCARVPPLRYTALAELPKGPFVEMAIELEKRSVPALIVVSPV